MSRVLVTGTDRPVGKAILPRLVKHNFVPIGLVGDPVGPVVSINHDEVPEGHIGVDVGSHDHVADAVNGVQAVIHAADVRPDGNVDIPASVRALALACAEFGAHFVLISRVGADASSLSHRKALWKAEQIVESTPGLGYTIQRVTHPHSAVEALLKNAWLPLPKATPMHPVSPADIAGRVVGLVQVGPSQRVRDYGGPELMRFADIAHIHKQVRGSSPRKVPLPSVGVIGEALQGVHVTKAGDRGSETFRQWLRA